MLPKPPLPRLPSPRVRSGQRLSKQQRHTISGVTPIQLPMQSFTGSPAAPLVPRGSKLTRRLSEVGKKETTTQPAFLLDKSKKSSSYKPRALPVLTDISYDLIVIFNSNWGNPDHIKCSEIDFLDKDKIPLPVTAVNPLSRNENAKEFRCLSNMKLIKEAEDHIFTHPWPSSSPLAVSFTIATLLPPEYIRVWNPQSDGDAGVRNLTVVFDGSAQTTIECPRVFGVVERINTVPSLPSPLDGLGLQSDPDLPSDSFGRLPLRPSSEVSLTFSRPFGGGDRLGLNALELFDSAGNDLSVDDIDAISLRDGAVNIRTPYNLLKDARRTSNPMEMWLVDLDTRGSATLTISLKKPALIVLARVWNYNAEDGSLGARHCSVALDGRPAGAGALRRARGLTSSVGGVSDVWLADPAPFKEISSIANIVTSRYDKKDKDDPDIQ